MVYTSILSTKCTYLLWKKEEYGILVEKKSDVPFIHVNLRRIYSIETLVNSTLKTRKVN